MTDTRPPRRPNPLSPFRMTPTERRAELCGLLALGLIRLRMRTQAIEERESGDISLHSSIDRSGHATPTHRRNA